MHWQLTREVFGPNIHNIAGVDNKVSDTLIRLPSTTRILYMQKLRLNVKECCMGDSHWKSLGLTYRIYLALTTKQLIRLVGRHLQLSIDMDLSLLGLLVGKYLFANILEKRQQQISSRPCPSTVIAKKYIININRKLSTYVRDQRSGYSHKIINSVDIILFDKNIYFR